MKRHHGFHGILPGDWSRHPQPNYSGCQLCHLAPGLPHLLHPVRLPGQRPHQGVRPRHCTGAAQPVTHTPGGHAELARLIPLWAKQHGRPWWATNARPEPGARRKGAGEGEGEEKHSGLRKRRNNLDKELLHIHILSPGLLFQLYLFQGKQVHNQVRPMQAFFQGICVAVAYLGWTSQVSQHPLMVHDKKNILMLNRSCPMRTRTRTNTVSKCCMGQLHIIAILSGS